MWSDRGHRVRQCDSDRDTRTAREFGTIATLMERPIQPHAHFNQRGLDWTPRCGNESRHIGDACGIAGQARWFRGWRDTLLITRQLSIWRWGTGQRLTLPAL